MKIPHHNLIDQEEPRCLYCQSRCDVVSDSTMDHAGFTIGTETLTCRTCEESFVIGSKVNFDGKASYTGFLFSCQDLSLLYRYACDSYLIGKSHSEKSSFMETPIFEVDFSDKKKLYDKLKTYIIFS